MNARIELLQAMPIFGALREETLDFLLLVTLISQHLNVINTPERDSGF